METPRSTFRLPASALALLDALVAAAAAKDPAAPYAQSRTAMLLHLIAHHAKVLHVSAPTPPPTS